MNQSQGATETKAFLAPNIGVPHDASSKNHQGILLISTLSKCGILITHLTGHEIFGRVGVNKMLLVSHRESSVARKSQL